MLIDGLSKKMMWQQKKLAHSLFFARIPESAVAKGSSLANIPIIILHDTQDTLFSIDNARKLYCKIKKNNPDVYLLETSNKCQTDDALLINSPDNDKQFLLTALHAIYNKHNLPYNYHYFNHKELIFWLFDFLGTKKKCLAIDLNYFQPSIKEVMQRLTNSDKKIVSRE